MIRPSSYARCALSRSCLPDERHAHGDVERERAREPHHLATRHEADAHVRIEELGAVRGDRDVAGGDEVEARRRSRSR